MARWRSSQRSSLIRRRPRVRIPLEPPIFSKRGRAANAARCKRDALTGYEGASPSASTILHPTRRKRRTVLVRQTAGRTSLWMLQILRMWWNSRHAGPRSRRAQAREGAIPSVRTNLSRRGWNVDTAASNPAGRNCPCRCDSGRRDQSCGRAWNSRPGGIKNRCAVRRVGVQVAPAAPNLFGEWWSVYTRVSETRGRKPVQVQTLSRRPNFRRVVQSEPSAL